MTRVKTARTTYNVIGVEIIDGRVVLKGKSDKGALRLIHRKDVTTTRWHAALAHYYSKIA